MPTLGGPQYPNQQYGWVQENDGSWSLYAPDGTLVISTPNGRAQVVTPSAAGDIANKGYVDGKPGGAIAVRDGTTTVSNATEVDFTSGATVTNAGGGVAHVAVNGGSQPVAQVSFAFDTPNLLTGLPLMSVKAGDVVPQYTAVSVGCPVEWDAVSPTLHIGVADDLTRYDAAIGPNTTLPLVLSTMSPDAAAGTGLVLQADAGNGGEGGPTAGTYRFTSDEDLVYSVDDGSGGAPGGTAGEAVLTCAFQRS